MIEYPTVYVTLLGDDSTSTASRFRTLVSEVPAAPDVGSGASLVEELEKALAPPPTERVDSVAAKEEVREARMYGVFFFFF